MSYKTANVLRDSKNLRPIRMVPSIHHKSQTNTTKIQKMLQIQRRLEVKNGNESVRKKYNLDRKSKLLSLNLFLDEDRLRVGSRLQHAILLDSKKHAIIISISPKRTPPPTEGR
ncbi:hypothetical protein JTB14_000797 [Gonioctena quinquepunctata]|nr:hypothetical protein JTB14_000797 [Gonioctena quinquepunctata]